MKLFKNLEVLKEAKAKTEAYWTKYLTEAPESVKKDTLTYYANMRWLLSSGKGSYTKPEVTCLTNFIKAITKLGISDKEFKNYRTTK